MLKTVFNAWYTSWIARRGRWAIISSVDAMSSKQNLLSVQERFFFAWYSLCGHSKKIRAKQKQIGIVCSVVPYSTRGYEFHEFHVFHEWLKEIWRVKEERREARITAAFARYSGLGVAFMEKRNDRDTLGIVFRSWAEHAGQKRVPRGST